MIIAVRYKDWYFKVTKIEENVINTSAAEKHLIYATDLDRLGREHIFCVTDKQLKNILEENYLD